MEANLAVLIDFENIAAGTEKEGLGRFDVDSLMTRLKDKGRILVARSYADWGRFARFKQGLLTANVNMYELTSHGGHDKNRADIAMVVDALELAFTRDHLDTFVIVSGDSDFTPLALKMRELNKRVIGVGTRTSTSRLLVNACDEFLFYDTIVRRTRRKPEPQTQTRQNSLSIEEGFDLLVQTIEGLQSEESDAPHASIVKTSMRRKQPDFSEAELGFTSFTRFLEAAENAGKVTTFRDQKQGGVRLMPAGEEEGAPRRRAPAPPKDDDDANNPTQGWSDPYLPAGVEPWVDVLTLDGINPLAAPTRKTILEAFHTAVEQRRERKRRVSVQFVQEDVRRELRRSQPDLPSRAIRAVFNALIRANVLMHKDGTPVRTPSAPFVLEKDPAQLNQVMLTVYLTALKDHGAPLTDIPLLAELFLGDRDRTQQVEESLAWLAADFDAVLDAETDFEERDVTETDDLDSLLSMDDEPVKQKAAPKAAQKAAQKAEQKAAPKAVKPKTVISDDFEAALEVDESPKAAPKATPKAAPESKEVAKAAQAPKPKTVVSDDFEAALEVDESPKAAPKAAQKAAPKAAPEAAEEPKVAATADDAPPAEEAPKKAPARKRAATKKTTAAKKTAAAKTDDAEEAAPVKKRRTTTKSSPSASAEPKEAAVAAEEPAAEEPAPRKRRRVRAKPSATAADSE